MKKEKKQKIIKFAFVIFILITIIFIIGISYNYGKMIGSLTTYTRTKGWNETCNSLNLTPGYEFKDGRCYSELKTNGTYLCNYDCPWMNFTFKAEEKCTHHLLDPRILFTQCKRTKITKLLNKS